MIVDTSPTDAAHRIRVLVVDDHPVVRSGLRDMIDAHPDLVVIAEAENGEQAIACFRDGHRGRYFAGIGLVARSESQNTVTTHHRCPSFNS